MKRRPTQTLGKIAASLALALSPAASTSIFAAPNPVQEESKVQQIQFAPIPPLGETFAGKQVSFLDEENRRVNRILGDVSDPESAYNRARIAASRFGSQTGTAAKDVVVVTGRRHTLKNLDATVFEKQLVEKFGEKLEIRTSTDLRYARFNWPTAADAKSQMLLDRKTRECHFEGNNLQLAGWQALLAELENRSVTQTELASMTTDVRTPVVRKQLDAKPTGNVATSSSVATDKTTVENSVSAKRTEQRIPIQPDRIDSVVQTAYLMGFRPVQQDDQVTKTLPLDQNAQGFDPSVLQQMGLKGQIQIQIDRERNQIIIVGDPEDVEKASRMVDLIRTSARASLPVVERIPLKNQTGTAAAEIIQQAYDTSFQSLQGSATVSALPSDDGVLAIGSKKAIESIKIIASQVDVDQELPPGEQAFQTYRIKHMSAIDAKERIDTYFGQSAQAAPNDTQPAPQPVVTIADYRSNTLIVKGPAKVQKDVQDLLEVIDVESAEEAAKDIVKVFQLKNSIANEMALVIQAAINGQQPNAPQPSVLTGQNQGGQGAQGQAGLNNQVQNTPTTSNTRAAMLILKTIGEQAGVDGGFMFDTKIVADSNSNSLVVTAPEKSMPLIEKLIEQLDRLPNAETQIKVFKIVNGDAQLLFNMLQTLFTGTAGAQGAQGGQAGQTNTLNQLPLQTASATDGATLANLRFTVDVRTNSIIATGPVGDLEVVHELLIRLDEDDMQHRRVDVFRLSNAPVLDVADALNTWLVERESQNEFFATEINRYNRRVIIVPEVISNSLLISARPEYFAEIERLIKAFDRRPPMVKVKVMIAEVDLDNLEEFGFELGIQDSLLFDRGLSATDPIGFNFNQGGIGNENVGRESLAGQALSNLGVGRVSSASSVGGLVLQAGNESVSVLMRALSDKNCLRILSSPELMTIENLQGRVQVGARVPFVSQTTQNIGGGITSGTEFQQVGVLLGVTPRVSPDGMVVMFVDVTNSSLGSVEAGVPVFVSDGQVVNQPQINETTAQTSVMARSGQTVVFSGLIQETKSHGERGVPILKDIPGIGPLFKFEFDTAERRELLIFLTPYIVDSEQTLDQLNQAEMDRMHWCLSDVAEIYGNVNYNGLNQAGGEVEVIYPGQDPAGLNPQSDDSGQTGWGPQSRKVISSGNSVAQDPKGQNKRNR